MGNSEGEKPAKSEKASSPPREQGNVHVYPDWAAVQAYYGPGAIPPPYYPAVTSGHAAHPYMWAPPQMMPPYGSPYAAMYPHGGIYGPSAAPVVATPLSLETPTRSSGNDSGLGKKHKESDAPAASGNGNTESAGDASGRGQSQSTECGTEGSCDRSDESTVREQDSSRSINGVTKSETCHTQMTPQSCIDASAGNGIVPGIPMASAITLASAPMPTAEMNHPLGAKANGNAVNISAPSATRPIGDERELKREKRKQSNRESARRSRLRKQAEMEELGKKVDCLTVENMALRSEINKLVEDSETLKSENNALVEKFKHMQGEIVEAVPDQIDDQENSHINTENLLSRVDNAVSNGDHEQGGEEK